jgi:hypothetical protein
MRLNSKLLMRKSKDQNYNKNMMQLDKSLIYLNNHNAQIKNIILFLINKILIQLVLLKMKIKIQINLNKLTKTFKIKIIQMLSINSKMYLNLYIDKGNK